MSRPPPEPSPQTTTPSPNHHHHHAKNTKEHYRAIVVDSGAIIKGAGLSHLHNSAQLYYTIPAVLDEIRDKKARQHLESLPFELQTREPSPESCRAVAAFSRLTGDYRSLSLVDMKVLALQYDLETEGCGNSDHLRKQPKRALIGKIQPLPKTNKTDSSSTTDKPNQEVSPDHNNSQQQNNSDTFELEVEQGGSSDDDSDDGGSPIKITHENNNNNNNNRSKEDNDTDTRVEQQNAPKTWAMVLNPTIDASPKVDELQQQQQQPSPLSPRISDSGNLNETFCKMGITGNVHPFPPQSGPENDLLGGQFSDAEEDDKEKNTASDKEFSDEECDVYILEPDEVEARKQDKSQLSIPNECDKQKNDINIESPSTTHILSQSNTPSTLKDELNSDFPSLTAAMTVPYEGSDDEHHTSFQKSHKMTELEEEKRKNESLKPITKQSGRLYNSFRKYGHVVTPQGVGDLKKKAAEYERERETKKLVSSMRDVANSKHPSNSTIGGSRIMGGNEVAMQSEEVDDDGEGWVNVGNIKSVKASGGISGFSMKKTSQGDKRNAEKEEEGPPLSDRCACATTDFAMQNVIIQMGMKLLSIDGVTVRKLKTWVTRCGACFTVYGNEDSKQSSRLFCERCGSDALHRIAASVSAKTGRYRLHFSKKRMNNYNLRGSKYSLPKPGKGNRFEGDLLLREDQLFTGAWNQKVKKGAKHVDSMFGSDIASQVGLGDLTKRSDIKVGFGRQNPNASKFGRERRGKKKKSADKACGLRRY